MREERIAGTQTRGGWAGRGPHVERPQMLLWGEGDPGAAPAAPLQSPSFQGSRASIGPPGGHTRAPGPLWHSATSSHVWDQCYCLSASQAPPPLICAGHTFPTSWIVSGIRPGPLSIYPCRPRLAWGPSGATLRTPPSADDRDGGGSEKSSWRRWHLHEVEEEQNARLLERWPHSGPRPPRWAGPSPMGVGGAGTPWPTPAHTHPPAAALPTHRGWERAPRPRG